MEAVGEGLLAQEQRRRPCVSREILEEMKRLGYLAGPMVAVTLSFYLLQVISLMMVGHLPNGQLPLSSTAMAFSLATVTGFSLLVIHYSYLCFLCMIIHTTCRLFADSLLFLDIEFPNFVLVLHYVYM